MPAEVLPWDVVRPATPGCLPGLRCTMSSLMPGVLDRRRIVVADEDPGVVALVVDTLRADGYAVFHAPDALAATQLACDLDPCHLIISNAKVQGVQGVDLIHELRRYRHALPILYIANPRRSTPELEAQLPSDVWILREPFTAEQLRATVRTLLDRTVS